MLIGFVPVVYIGFNLTANFSLDVINQAQGFFYMLFVNYFNSFLPRNGDLQFDADGCLLDIDTCCEIEVDVCE